MTDSASQSLVERLNAARQDEKSVSTYAKLCREAAARITELEATVARIKTQRDSALIDMGKFMNIATDCCDVIGLPRENFAILPSELSRVEGRQLRIKRALHLAEEALSRCYDVNDFPADGLTIQDRALAAIRSLPPLEKRGEQKETHCTKPESTQNI